MAKKTSSQKKENTPVKDTAPAATTSEEVSLPSEDCLSNDKQFMIAGIGASAGGVEAVSALIKYLPSNLGIAYVVIQHLSPNHESILPEILQRNTSMPVHLVEDNMRVLQNNIYVIPPNTYMGIIDGHLRLAPRGSGVVAPHSIDYFFTGLAAHYQNKAIGIILSGMAPDGAAGIQTIKAEGGITFAQDDSAGFQGMPKNAVNTGFVDFILPPLSIAKELAVIAQLPYAVASPEQIFQEGEADIRKVHNLLHTRVGVDFSVYKQSTINRRILRRVGINRLPGISEYYSYLVKTPDEVERLYRDLLINVTFFFREPAQYKALRDEVFPALLKNRKPNDPIRIWIPACSTGEEACSIAICLFEYLGDAAMTTPVQIFATDLSEPAIEKARTGIYPKTALENVSSERIKRFFIKIDGSYQIVKAIRDICVYATHNLLKDPPFSRMDIISCQNVMIYLESGPKERIMNAFHYALKPTGFLILGKSETVGTAAELFDQVSKEKKIYVKKSVTFKPNMDFVPRTPSYTPPEELIPRDHFAKRPEVTIAIEKEADNLLLSHYVPASVVVNKDLNIIRFQGNTALYLRPASGRASLHLLRMLRDELVFEIKSLIYKVKKENQPATKEGIELAEEGRLRMVNIEVVPLRSSRDGFFMVIFKENKEPDMREPLAMPQRSESAKDKRLATLEADLKQARTEMKHMSEEFEATREELQSANEEVLSSNEELQSINEELETSKEELQSTNEELITINEELQHRNNDLKEAVEYTEAIVQTIREPLLVLNADLRVRAGNKAFYETFKLNSTDIEGHYFFEVAEGRFDRGELKQKLQEVITLNKSFYNVELKDLSTNSKVLMFSATRLNLEDSRNNRILLSIEDITEWKNAEVTLRESEERFRLLVQNAFDIITIFTKDGAIQYQS